MPRLNERIRLRHTIFRDLPNPQTRNDENIPRVVIDRHVYAFSTDAGIESTVITTGVLAGGGSPATTRRRTFTIRYIPELEEAYNPHVISYTTPQGGGVFTVVNVGDEILITDVQNKFWAVDQMRILDGKKYIELDAELIPTYTDRHGVEHAAYNFGIVRE